MTADVSTIQQKQRSHSSQEKQDHHFNTVLCQQSCKCALRLVTRTSCWGGVGQELMGHLLFKMQMSEYVMMATHRRMLIAMTMNMYMCDSVQVCCLCLWLRYFCRDCTQISSYHSTSGHGIYMQPLLNTPTFSPVQLTCLITWVLCCRLCAL